MINGYMNEDLYSLDIKRFQKFHSSKKFIMNRVTETLGDLYGMHWPYKQHKTSRDQKLLPYHEDLKKMVHVLVNQESMKDQCGTH